MTNVFCICANQYKDLQPKTLSHRTWAGRLVYKKFETYCKFIKKKFLTFEWTNWMSYYVFWKRILLILMRLTTFQKILINAYLFSFEKVQSDTFPVSFYIKEILEPTLWNASINFICFLEICWYHFMCPPAQTSKNKTS